MNEAQDWIGAATAVVVVFGVLFTAWCLGVGR